MLSQGRMLEIARGSLLAVPSHLGLGWVLQLFCLVHIAIPSKQAKPNYDGCMSYILNKHKLIYVGYLAGIHSKQTKPDL